MFKYLGSLIKNTNEIEAEKIARIIAGNKCYHALGNLLKKRYIAEALRVGLYKTILRPIVTYCAESWTLTSKMERVLMTWERKILRKMYGQTYENGCWRIKTNQEIYNKFKSQNIVTVIKVCRWEWIGHVRVDSAGIVKKLLEGKRGGGRKSKT
jgi:hypothetical protein